MTPRRYETYVIALAPLLNSLSGIAIDLYAPSLPAIGREFGVPVATAQATITVTLAAYAAGQIAFGLAADCLGRLRALFPGLALFLAGSLLAVAAPSIELLMLARAMQGFAIGACQVVARALLVDNVSGERFYAAVVYLSLAWGLGPVVAPFVGGYVQEWAGWRWNFVLYAAYGALLLAASLGLRESLPAARRMRLRDALAGYARIAASGRFLCAALALGASLAAFLAWNVAGPYLVQDELGRPPSDFGATALAAGAAYLAGTLLNRLLIRRYRADALILAGLGLFAAGAALPLAAPGLHLAWLLGGVALVNFGQGLLFSNVVAKTLMLFPDRAGASASLFGCLMMICGAAGSAAIGQAPIRGNAAMAAVFAALLLVQAGAVAGLLRPRRRAGAARAAP